MPALFWVVFVAVFLSVYGFAHFYFLRHAIPALSSSRRVRVALVALCVALGLSFLGGRFLEGWRICLASKALVWVGSLWMGVVLYAFLATLVADLVRLAERRWHFLPASATPRRIVALCSVAILAVVAAGFANAWTPRPRTLQVPIAKRAGALDKLTVVLASDIHLGTIVGKQRFSRMVETINALQPDVILLAGDIIDEDLKPVIDEDAGDTLRQLKARYGVFGITGNHEFIAGVDAAVGYLEEHGVRMLRDRTVEIAGAVVIAGRDDVSAPRFGAPERRPLPEVLRGVDPSKPVILLDHQPKDFGPALESKVDLQISGHTHNGQLFPFFLITRAIYELSWGLEQRAGTWFYVSCGAGTWGPPLRLAAEPEIVRLELTFQR
ncbi:MAG TPA: metallophosphoesterase [Myxococcales bacterium]